MRVGQLLCGGFQGTTVTPQSYHLIVQHHISSMILSKKNFSSVQQITKLIRDLQYIAMTQGGQKYPLMFAVDAEGGMMNSLYDPEFLTQFPGAMALAATGDCDLIYEVSKAVAVELKTIGFSILLGPVLDVVTKLSHQLVGVRSFGTTPEEVIKYGRACTKGLRDGGIYTVGKHFPGIGNASVDSLLELPMMTDSLDQIRNFNIQPFRQLIKENLLDGVSAAGCAIPGISPDEIHACLSPIILNQVLRQELKFDGMVVSECLEMDALLHSIGLGQGVILALYAGCDLVMVCHNLSLQNEAIESMEKALKNGNLDEDILNASMRRIEKLQKGLPTWQQMFPEGEKSARDELILLKTKYPAVWERHQKLSEQAYKKSVTLVRDFNGTLPINKWLTSPNKTPANPAAPAEVAAATSGEDSNILILTPLLNPLLKSEKGESNDSQPQLYQGEEVFKKFGELLANHPFNKNDGHHYNVLHTSYTANGLTALHESLIQNSQVVIVITSEASRNMYQIGIVKYISILCGANPYSFSNNGSNTQLSKPLVIVATSSPYDFFYNKSIGSTYLCCYDYTDNVLHQLVGVLMGDIQAEGCIPGEKKFVSAKSKKRKLIEAQKNTSNTLFGVGSTGSGKVPKRNPTPKRRWLVDELDLQRDWSALFKLWKNNSNGESDHEMFSSSTNDIEQINYQMESFYKMLYFLLRTNNKTQKHFVVRNASLNILYGVALTWVNEHQSVPIGSGEINLEEVNDQYDGKVGSIMYVMVDKAKRAQSIGKNLHARAMRYLAEEQKCKVVTLGCSFPLISLPNAKLISENTRVASFFHNVGWDVHLPRSDSTLKHIMILDNLSTWSVPKKIFRELMIVGVRFDVCSNPEQLLTLIDKISNKNASKGKGNKNSNSSDVKEESDDEMRVEERDDEEDEGNDTEDGDSSDKRKPKSRSKKLSEAEQQENYNIKALYMEAIKYLDNNAANGVKIIIALEPTNQNVIGSVILFNNHSHLAKFFPFINQASTAPVVNGEEPIIGGIIGPIIDPSYSNLTEIFKFGLICSGITFLKSSNSESSSTKMDQCIIIGIDEQKSSNIKGIKDIGFKEWKQYYDYYVKREINNHSPNK